MTAPGRYPLRTRILHWLTAVLVFSMLLIGFAMVNSIGSYASLRAVHMTLGIVVLVIVVLRAANRLTHRVPKLPDTVGWVEHKLVVGSELALYTLLLAQPLARARLVLAHFLVDCVTIPCLCLALFAGNLIGVWRIDPIQVRPPAKEMRLPFKVPTNDDPEVRKQLVSHPKRFFRAAPVVGGLIFGICGLTMWISSMGRYRWRVMGVAVGVVLLMFLINVLGQMWDPASWLRPATLFYYYQPQQVIPEGGGWFVAVGGVPVPMLLVLYGVGAVGYALALVTFVHRDLPAPL